MIFADRDHCINHDDITETTNRRSRAPHLVALQIALHPVTVGKNDELPQEIIKLVGQTELATMGHAHTPIIRR